jgi:ribosomal protein L16 Arg81 hydroxylase
MTTLGLQNLLAPKSIEEFLSTDFQRRPCVIQGRDPSLYAGLLSLEQVEYAIDTVDPQDGSCRLMGGKDPTGRRSIEAKGELRDALAAYGRGASINLSKLDRRFTSVSDVRRRMRADFAAHGVFLTDHGDSVVFITPTNSQALSPHTDPDDLFILQFEGRKHWKVYGWDPFWRDAERREPPPPALEVELTPGDLLYVPQHWIHAASAGEHFSYAMTLGFRPVSWAELLKSLAGQLSGVAPLFEALPPWAVAEGHLTTRGQDQFIEILKQLLDTPACRKRMERIEIKAAIASAGSGGIAAMNRVRLLDTQTVCTLAGAAKVERLEDGIEIAVAGRRLKGPVTIESALLWIAEQPKEFAVGSIGGALTEDAKVVLARRLILEGILHLEPGSQASL